MYRFFWWAFVLIFVMLIAPTYLEACPGCKALNDPIGKGFNFSILFMIAMPFTVFGVIGGTIFLHFNGFQFSVISYRLKKRLMRVKNLFTDNRRLTTDNE